MSRSDCPSPRACPEACCALLLRPTSQLRQQGAHLARMEDGHVAQRLPVTRSPQANSASQVRTSQEWRMGMSRSDCPSPGACPEACCAVLCFCGPQAPQPLQANRTLIDGLQARPPPARCAPRKDGGWACRAATARQPELAQKRAVLCFCGPQAPQAPHPRQANRTLIDGLQARPPPVRCAPRKNGGWACRAATARHPEPTSQLRQQGAHLARMEDGHVAQRLPVNRSPQANSASKVRTSQEWRMGMSRSDCPSPGAHKLHNPVKPTARSSTGYKPVLRQ